MKKFMMSCNAVLLTLVFIHVSTRMSPVLWMSA